MFRKVLSYVCVFISIYAYTRTHAQIPTRTHPYLHTHTPTHPHILTHAPSHTHSRTHTHTHTHTRTYTHTHTRTQRPERRPWPCKTCVYILKYFFIAISIAVYFGRWSNSLNPTLLFIMHNLLGPNTATDANIYLMSFATQIQMMVGIRQTNCL